MWREPLTSDELWHYGVLGMHWGITRTPAQLGHKPSRSKQETYDELRAKEIIGTAQNWYDKNKGHFDNIEFRNLNAEAFKGDKDVVEVSKKYDQRLSEYNKIWNERVRRRLTDADYKRAEKIYEDVWNDIHSEADRMLGKHKDDIITIYHKKGQNYSGFSPYFKEKIKAGKALSSALYFLSDERVRPHKFPKIV